MACQSRAGAGPVRGRGGHAAEAGARLTQTATDIQLLPRPRLPAVVAGQEARCGQPIPDYHEPCPPEKLRGVVHLAAAMAEGTGRDRQGLRRPVRAAVTGY